MAECEAIVSVVIKEVVPVALRLVRRRAVASACRGKLIQHVADPFRRLRLEQPTRVRVSSQGSVLVQGVLRREVIVPGDPH